MVPGGEPPSSSSGVPASSCTAAAGRKDGPPGAAEGPARPGGWVWTGLGWGHAPLTIQGADAEKAQREPRSHLASPVLLLFTQAPPWASGSLFSASKGRPRGQPGPLTPSLGALCPGPGAAGLQGPAADTQDTCVQKWEGVAGSGVAAGKSDPDPAPRMRRSETSVPSKPACGVRAMTVDAGLRTRRPRGRQMLTRPCQNHTWGCRQNSQGVGGQKWE